MAIAFARAAERGSASSHRAADACRRRAFGYARSVAGRKSGFSARDRADSPRGIAAAPAISFEVQPPIARAQASPQTLLSLFLLSCAARYAARLSAGALGESREHARALYAELSLILTEHATQYASLLGHAGDPCEALTLRAYALCYALDGLRAQEEDAALRAIYDQAFYAQCAHLHKARRLYLRAYEGQEPPFIDQELPPQLLLQPDKGDNRLAAAGRTGSHPEPLAERASQPVAGMKYCLRCRLTVVYPDAQPTYALVYVYQNIEGACELARVDDITFSIQEPVAE